MVMVPSMWFVRQQKTYKSLIGCLSKNSKYIIGYYFSYYYYFSFSPQNFMFSPLCMILYSLHVHNPCTHAFACIDLLCTTYSLCICLFSPIKLCFVWVSFYGNTYIDPCSEPIFFGHTLILNFFYSLIKFFYFILISPYNLWLSFPFILISLCNL